MTHNGPLGLDERRRAQLFACPPGSALAGATSLELDGLEGFASEQTDVVLPDGARDPDIAGLVPHWSIYLDDRDVNPIRAPRRTRSPRSAIDFASWSDNERYARAVILATVQQRLVRTHDLREALARRGNCRHRGLIVESILDAGGGIQSLPERDFNTIRSQFGLPEPSRQSKIQRKDGRYYLDVEWRKYAVGCEIHGIPHLEVKKWDADVSRGNEIAISGRRVLIFTSYATRRTPVTVGDQLVRLLESAGWRR